MRIPSDTRRALAEWYSRLVKTQRREVERKLHDYAAPSDRATGCVVLAKASVSGKGGGESAAGALGPERRHLGDERRQQDQ
jgi:hypothetical protein